MPEYEFYFFRQGRSPTQSSQVQTPFMVKYTWAPQRQLSLMSTGYQQIEPSASAPTATGLGDPSLSVEYLYQPPGKGAPAQALAFTYEVAATPVSLGLSDGRDEYFLTWLATGDLGTSVGWDANAWGNYLGDTQGVWRLQFNQAADLNWEFAKD